ncbi:helix-turn-helix domain-containing protein [Clostridioides sp. ES-S-0145-01]|uniref:helix-turn-helix transcriptional regulator n=1 Tax=Clostridioides sp. ES-S-0145-01 TaxID=2770784 RepID=UPI001D12FD0C|nr:helix-turn-helix transcriptional regulator [Clostridioides difficile]
MALKDRIKEERLKLNLNQVELAKIFNVTKQTVSNWESGNRIPDTLMLTKLADFFNISVDSLLGRPSLDKKYSNDKFIDELDSPDDIKELIKVFMNLDEESKEKMLKIAQVFIDEEKSNKK